MAISDLRKRIQDVEGFGPKNIALISAVAVFLLVLSFSERPLQSTGSLIQAPPQPNSYVALNGVQNQSAQSSAVLGASTVNDQLAQKFSSINVKTISDNSDAAIQNYKDQVAIVLNAEGLTQKTLSDWQNIAVPDSYAQYHRMLLVYYGVKLAQSSGQDTGIDPSSLDTLMSYLQGQLSSVGLIQT